MVCREEMLLKTCVVSGRKHESRETAGARPGFGGSAGLGRANGLPSGRTAWKSRRAAGVELDEAALLDERNAADIEAAATVSCAKVMLDFSGARPGFGGSASSRRANG